MVVLQMNFKKMNNNKISGSEAVVKCLIAEGVDIIYGYPGGAIMPVYDELYKFQNEIHHVLNKGQHTLRRDMLEFLEKLV